METRETHEQHYGAVAHQPSWPPGDLSTTRAWEHPHPSASSPAAQAAPGFSAATRDDRYADMRPGPSQTLQLLRATNDPGQPGHRLERPRALLYKLALGFQAMCLRRWPVEFPLDLEQMEHVIRIPVPFRAGMQADAGDAVLYLWHRIEQRTAPWRGDPIQALLVWTQLDVHGQVAPALATDLAWAMQSSSARPKGYRTDIHISLHG